MFENGLGVPQNYTEAASWYRRAADLDYVEAQNNLGSLYRERLGRFAGLYAGAAAVPARCLIRTYAPAQNNLAGMYQKGLGVPRDYVEAVRLYSHAADQADALAQNNLGAMYASGQGVPQDYVVAHMWFSLSLASGQHRCGGQSSTGRRD